MYSGSKANLKSYFSSRMRNIHKTVEHLKPRKHGLREEWQMESIWKENQDEENMKNEWTVSVFKDNLRVQLLQPMQSKMETNSKSFKNFARKDVNYVFLWAAFRGQLNLMQLCAEKGADVSFIYGNTNFNALHLSAIAGSVECCQWLLEKGCPIIQTSDQMTPIHYATLGNSKDVVEFLINYGCGIPSTAINSAVYANAIQCVKFLLALEADVNIYHEGMTPLHVATDLRYIECMEELLDDSRIDPNAKTDLTGYTALHLAAENGYADCIELLLKKNAKINELNKKLQTPLHLACKMECLDCVEVLLKNRASVNEKDLDHKTPLHAAVAKSPYSLAKIKLLVQWKANVNVSDRYGYTPLHLAAINEAEECVTFLILNGANVAAETKSGTSALNMINRKTPKSVPAIWKRLTKSLAYNTEKSLKFSFRELITNSNIGEIGFLYVLQKENHKDILKHPLCKAFLYLKWEKIKLIYFIRVFFVVLTACILSYLILNDVIEKECDRSQKNNSNVPENSSSRHCNCTEQIDVKQSKPNNNEDMKYFLNCMWYIALVLVFSNVLRSLLCKDAYPSIKRYLLNNLNLFEFAMVIILSILFVLENFIYMEWTCPVRKLIGTGLILLTWTYLTLVIGQLPFFGTYITMFSKVLKELLKLLTVYFCLLIGFTVTFSAILREEPNKFDDEFLGFAQTLTMMTGELNGNDLLKKHVEGIGNRSNIHVYVAAVALIFFIVVVNMALMNLLIGIAVSDVEGLQKTADLSKLVHQTKLIYYLEFALFRGYLSKKITKMFKNCFFVSPNFYRVVMYVRPLNPLEKRLPQDIMKEALQLALDKNKPEEEDANDEVASRLEEIENKMTEMFNMLSNLSNVVTKKTCTDDNVQG
ncbi:transient receptor potential channel pyrexia-like [Planococcus citri]|uniref:transient receptor potential channel pyrexia-like n=1 Tax=Planococcus citri TaxID=170843 RepID=UPI0031F8FA48